MNDNMTYQCRWVRARLPLMAGDDLRGSERRLAERHLVVCPACRQHLADLRATVDLLRTAVSAPIAAPALWPDLARQIRESRRPQPSLRWPRALAWPVTVLAASMLLTVTSLLAFTPRRAAPLAAGRPTPPRLLLPDRPEPAIDEFRPVVDVGRRSRAPLGPPVIQDTH